MKFASTLKSVATAALTSAAAAGQSLSASAGATYYVTPEADGTGTGASWESPWTLANAFSKVANGDVLLVKAGTYDYKSALTISKVITVRGGLKGTDDTTLAGSNSVFHAAATALFITLSSDTSASDTNVFERCTFSGASEKGRAALYKTGKTSIRLESCRFCDNGSTQKLINNNRYLSGYGIGLHVEGSADAVAVVTNCVFDGNNSNCQMGTDGCALYARNLGRLIVEDCLFLTNGVSWAAQVTIGNHGNVGQKGGLNGSAICVDGVPVTVRGCRFIANVSTWLSGACGLTVNKGTVRVRNSILYGNSRGSGGTCGKDIAVAAAGSVDIAYSLVEADTNVTGSAASITAVSNECLRIDRKTTVFGDPLFVTDLATMRPLVGNAAKIAEALACNLHVRGGTGYRDEVTKEVVQTYVKRKRSDADSPAIDAGDPASDWRKETKPCGCRVNLGFYGNTPWATMSKGGTMIFVR